MHLKYFFKYGISIFGIFFVDRSISKLHSYYKGIQHIVSHLSYIIFNGTNSYVSCAWMPKCRQAYNGRFFTLGWHIDCYSHFDPLSWYQICQRQPFRYIYIYIKLRMGLDVKILLFAQLFFRFSMSPRHVIFCKKSFMYLVILKQSIFHTIANVIILPCCTSEV